MWVYFQLVLAMVMYGGSFVSTKAALAEVGPLWILLIRLLISATFLVALDAFIPSRTSHPTAQHVHKWPRTADIPILLLITLFQPLLYFVAENLGLQSVSASLGAIIIATIPVFTPIVAAPLLRERTGIVGFLGLALSLSGVSIIVLGPEADAEFTALGLALMFVAVFAAVGYTVSIRTAPARYRPLTIVKMQSVMGLPIVVLLAILVEGLPVRLPSPGVALHLAFLGLFPSSLAFVFFSTGIRELGASRASVFTNLVPVFTALFSWVLLGELFTAQKVLGMAVVVGGVLTAQLAGLRRLISRR